VTRRLLVSYLALTLAVLLTLQVPLALGYADRLSSELQNDLQRDAFALAGISEDTLEGSEQLDLQAVAEQYVERSDARVVIVDASGEVLADSSGLEEGKRFDTREEFAAALAGQVVTGERRSETLGTGLIYAAVPVASGEVHGAVRITYSTDQLDARVRSYWLTLAAVGLVSLGAAAAVGILFARWVVRPLDQVRAAAVRLGAGELATRAPDGDGPPEVRQLAGAFNTTAARLEELVTAQEQFVADASHQLRTPLTALRLRLEVTAAAAADGEPVVDDVAAALTEVARLSRLVDGLLALARAERADPGRAAERLDVETLLRARADAWEPLAAEHGVAVVVAPSGSDSPATVVAGAERVHQVLDNLLANAVDASPDGAEVVLRHDLVPGGVELHVLDAGPGLGEDDRAHAFDRFWRATQASGAFGGSGLGLAIARKLAEADHATTELRAAPGGGVDAVVRYPAAPLEAPDRPRVGG
jgi:signal transduction histidine kinase